MDVTGIYGIFLDLCDLFGIYEIVLEFIGFMWDFLENCARFWVIYLSSENLQICQKLYTIT